MRHSPELRQFVGGWESCRLQPYEDIVGVWTVGYGHVLHRDEPREPWSQEQCDDTLDFDLADHGERLQPFLRRDDMTQQQYDALLSLAFNVGVAAVGSSGLVGRFNLGDDDETARRFLLWNRAGGQVVNGLTKRRRAEQAIFESGDYSGRP